MKQKSIDIFNVINTKIEWYYQYMHIGYFFSHLIKKEDLSVKVCDLPITIGNKTYILKKDDIRYSLRHMYMWQNSQQFSHLIYVNTTHGIMIAMFEILKNNQDVQDLFKEYIFINDEESYWNFREILMFIRDVFSHQYEDKFRLKKDDYERQKKEMKKNGDNIIVDFSFDYKNLPVPIEDLPIKIYIDFNNIKEGDLYTEIITDEQTMSFVKLCYNCMQYLAEEVKIKQMALYNLYVDIILEGLLGEEINKHFFKKEGHIWQILGDFAKEKGYETFGDWLDDFVKTQGYRSFEEYVKYNNKKGFKKFNDLIKSYEENERDKHGIDISKFIPNTKKLDMMIQDIWDSCKISIYNDTYNRSKIILDDLENYTKLYEKGQKEYIQNLEILVEGFENIIKLKYDEGKCDYDAIMLHNKTIEEYVKIKEKYPIIKELSEKIKLNKYL